ncbi:MAG: hypothetical protein QM674_08315 [Burkholderiaceae bacterium]
MLPSLLARDIRTGLEQYLISAYEPSDAYTYGLMSCFVDDEGAWLKGPYVQIGLPFCTGSAGRGFFAGFQASALIRNDPRSGERCWRCIDVEAPRLGAHARA